MELALGSDGSYNAFLLNPISIPPNTALVIDGGVTVYGSRDRRTIRTQARMGSPCGTVGAYPVDKGCLPLFSLTTDAASMDTASLMDRDIARFSIETRRTRTPVTPGGIWPSPRNTPPKSRPIRA